MNTTAIVSIISTVAITIFGGGGLAFYFSHKRKEYEKAKAAEFENLKAEIDMNKQLADTHRKTIIMYSEDIKNLRTDRDALKNENACLKYENTKLKRQYEGLKKAFHKEVCKKKHAEKNICFNISCGMREPDTGEYSTETEQIEESM